MTRRLPKAEVFIASRECPPGFDIGWRMGRCPGRRKIATRVPPSLCDVTQTSHPPDQTFENAVCAARVGVARDLKISPLQAKNDLVVVARTCHRSKRPGAIVKARAASLSTLEGGVLLTSS